MNNSDLTKVAFALNKAQIIGGLLGGLSGYSLTSDFGRKENEEGELEDPSWKAKLLGTLLGSVLGGYGLDKLTDKFFKYSPEKYERNSKRIADIFANPFSKRDVTTPRENIAPFYENVGGLDKQLSRAEKYINSLDDEKLKNSNVFLSTNPVDWDLKVPMIEDPNKILFPELGRYEMLVPKIFGKSNPIGGVLTMADFDAETSPIVKRHELSHALQGMRYAGNNRFKYFEDTNLNYSDTFNDYLLSDLEVGARLADLNRLYTYYTGNVVDSPERAREAFEWLRSIERPSVLKGLFNKLKRPFGEIDKELEDQQTKDLKMWEDTQLLKRFLGPEPDAAFYDTPYFHKIMPGLVKNNPDISNLDLLETARAYYS